MGIKNSLKGFYLRLSAVLMNYRRQLSGGTSIFSTCQVLARGGGGGGERVLNVAMLNDYAYVVNSLWEHPVCFPFENQEPSSRPGTEWVLEKKYLLNQRE